MATETEIKKNALMEHSKKLKDMAYEALSQGKYTAYSTFLVASELAEKEAEKL